MQRYRNQLVLFLVVLVAGCVSAPVREKTTSHLPPSHYEALEAAGCRVITTEELAASFKNEPMAVGFDVDDTVLFSSPGFYYGLTNTDGPNGSNLFGDDPLGQDAFWNALNTSFDAFSIPKRIAVKLIALHKERGDVIYFVTARPCPDNDPAPLTQRLNRIFELHNRHPVVFTNLGQKTEALRMRNIKVYYGDSDGDIKDAKEAGIRAIRVVRSPLSTNPSATHDGAFGEEVLFNSEN